MSDYGHARSTLEQSLRAVGALAQDWEEPLVAGACWSELERFQEGRLALVVCGEFKVGKSMLINALLDHPDLTPVGVDIATSTIIMIRGGESLRAFLAPLDGRDPTPIDAADIPRWASESHRRALDDAPGIILIEAPSPLLSDGLTVVDTPGVSGLDREHSEITFARMADADLVLFVTEAQRPLTTHELAFIADRILPLNRSFALVLSKADLQADLDAIVAADRDKLVPAIPSPAIFPVSSRLKLRHLETGDPQDLSESGHPALEAHIADVLKATGQTRLVDRAAQAVDDAAEKLSGPRRTELIALQGEGSAEFARMAADLEEAARRADRLHRNLEKWRNRLNFDISEIRTKLIERGLTRALVELETDFHAAANMSSATGDELNLVARDLEVGIRHIYVSARRQISEAAERLRVSLAAECGLELTPIVRDEEGQVRAPPPLRTEKTLGWTTKVGDWANQWRRQVFGGLTVGAFVGGVIGGAIGLFAGGVGVVPGFIAGMNYGAAVGMGGGALTGIPSANKSVREKQMARARETLETQLGPYLRLVNKEITDSCYTLLAAIKSALTEEFNLRIADADTDLRRRREGLQRGIEAEIETVEQRRTALRDQISLVETHRTAAIGARDAFRASKG